MPGPRAILCAVVVLLSVLSCGVAQTRIIRVTPFGLWECVPRLQFDSREDILRECGEPDRSVAWHSAAGGVCDFYVDCQPVSYVHAFCYRSRSPREFAVGYRLDEEHALRDDEKRSDPKDAAVMEDVDR